MVDVFDVVVFGIFYLIWYTIFAAIWVITTSIVMICFIINEIIKVLLEYYNEQRRT